ncbi:peptide/nickel transport system permease protein [Micromonospora rhizosphaerae]|uniref:Peptide/nickel transport system permease protein n=1 Tax=Micromonospora rhizosphaerae TaxID=568872 RepID=A0A1C6T4D9_9ACTN|nr:ABC transporter permease [Micromonospora rhizosphaerae]SCL36432.1 peptide/nickel transport system permease protein [Micromonospora rhizosphaerae]
MRILRLGLRRLLALVPVLLGVTVITFAIVRSVPGDPARAIAGPYADPQTIANVRAQWKLDDPISNQYLSYLGRLVRGDLGTSIQSRSPVRSDIAALLPATLELALLALAIMVIVGVGLGVMAAAQKNRAPDHVARVIAVLGAALPTFWLALVLQLVFFRVLDWLPAVGRLTDGLAPPPKVTGFYTVDSLIALDMTAFSDALAHIILPALTLALAGLAGICRITRASMLEVLEQDYIRAARARGISAHRLVLRHALRNALMPTVTVVGLLFGALIGGALVVEWIFGWPGVGTYAATSITNLDYPAIMGVTVVLAVVYLAANFVVDMLYLLLNPVLREY